MYDERPAQAARCGWTTCAMLGVGALGSCARADLSGARESPRLFEVRQAEVRASEDGGAAEPPRPRCLRDDRELVVLGDSYVNLPLVHTFPLDLCAVSGHHFPLAAAPGYSLAHGGLGLISWLFEWAHARYPHMHTVLMDGGGNDILLGDLTGQCKNAGATRVPACRWRVEEAVDALEALLERMAEVGVRDVVYFFYPNVPRDTVLGGQDPNAMVDYARALARPVCDDSEARSGGRLRCHFVDLNPVFDGRPQAEWFMFFDVHPTRVGSRAMAEYLWGEMTRACLGQGVASGCCE